MKTLDEIVASARLNEPLDPVEARYAIVAFDVLLAKLEIEQDAKRLKEWMIAAIMDPKEYAGEANDPNNPKAAAWYQAMRRVPMAGVFCTLCGRADHSASECDWRLPDVDSIN